VVILTSLDASYCYRNSVRLSVRHTGDSRLNGSKYRNMLCITRSGDVSSFLTLTFRGLVFSVHPDRGSRGNPPSTMIMWSIRRNNSETVRDRTQVSIIHSLTESKYGLLIGTRIGDLEWPWTAQWLLGPTASNSLKLDPYCQRQNVAHGVQFMAIYGL